MTYKLEIDEDVFDGMMAQALKEAYDGMTFDEQAMKYPRFSFNRDVEIERTYELRKALRLVHNHFSLSSEWINYLEDEL